MTDDDYDETETAHFHLMVADGFEREVESYGIADGMRRRPFDDAYDHIPAYRRGYAAGRRLPARPDDEAESDGDAPCRACGGHGYYGDGDDVAICHCVGGEV